MSWKRTDLITLITLDVDDVVHRARSLADPEQTAALQDAVEALRFESNPSSRLKELLFAQTLLSFFGDRHLASAVADVVTNELLQVVTGKSDPPELKRAALDGLALLFLKAKELTPVTEARVRAAFEAARASSDPELRAFATAAVSERGVLSRRKRQDSAA